MAECHGFCLRITEDRHIRRSREGFRPGSSTTVRHLRCACSAERVLLNCGRLSWNGKFDRLRKTSGEFRQRSCRSRRPCGGGEGVSAGCALWRDGGGFAIGEPDAVPVFRSSCHAFARSLPATRRLVQEKG